MRGGKSVLIAPTWAWGSRRESTQRGRPDPAFWSRDPRGPKRTTSDDVPHESPLLGLLDLSACMAKAWKSMPSLLAVCAMSGVHVLTTSSSVMRPMSAVGFGRLGLCAGEGHRFETRRRPASSTACRQASSEGAGSTRDSPSKYVRGESQQRRSISRKWMAPAAITRSGGAPARLGASAARATRLRAKELETSHRFRQSCLRRPPKKSGCAWKA